jgi:glyoxylase-like metal-dependent hydrolase (beta-lactamase superfamily II)
MPRLIDTLHLGRDRVIGAHVVRDLVIDPGPASALENWIGELAEPPRAVLLTHIHLDHAAATGVLARRFPELKVYVSEVGAPHVVDPERLLASAGRLYGPENMDRLWGEVAPVAEERIISLAGGEEVEGFRVLHTPGHAGHHVCYFDEETGDAYVGDMAGVRIPPGDYTVPPTPPPEIDVEAWLASVDTIEEREPTALHLTHFGAAEPGPQLDRLREALRRNAELARADERDLFLETIAQEIEAHHDPEAAASLRQAAPPEQLWLGLERYWRKRQA